MKKGFPLSIYENNLIAFSSVDKALADKLKSITTNEKYEVFVTDMEHLSDLRIVDNRDATAIDNSMDDINNKLKEFEEFDNYYALYFFGIGSGVFYKELLKNLNHKHIYIFEPEIELIYIVLNLIDFSADILQKRLVITQSSDVNLSHVKSIITKESILYLKKYNLDIYSSYYDKYPEEIKKLNSIIILLFKHGLQAKGNSFEDFLIGFRHSSKNMLQMFRYPSLKKVFDSVNDRKDAVIVSTGPSLQKQLPLLKKYQDYFTILSVDASFPILAKAGIKPDIVLSMERVSETSKFYKDTPREFHKDVVFAIATICHEDTFNAIDTKSGILCPYLRADRHNMIDELKEWGYLGGGLSSANYLLDFAIKAKFENIVFIGQDLSYARDGSSHSKGHVYGEDEIKDDKSEGYIEAYGGKGKVTTMRWWNAFRNAFILQISEVKKDMNINIYNATEGGARIDGTVEIAFKKYCENILNKSEIKSKLNLEYPLDDNIKRNTTNYVTKCTELLRVAKSLRKKAEKTFYLVEDFIGKIKKIEDTKVENNIKNKEINDLLDKINEVRDKYNRPIFIETYSSYFISYLSHLDFDLAAITTMRENTPEAIKLKKINYIKVNYEWLYRLAGSLKIIIEIFEDSLKKA